MKFLGKHKEINSTETIYSFSTGTMDELINHATIDRFIKLISEKISEEWCKENMTEVFKKLDSQTILNLALAKSAAKVFDKGISQ